MGRRVIILTGEREAGKSTACRETIALAQARGYTCGGVLTLSRPDGALDLLDVQSGDIRRLTVGIDAGPVVIQGRFRFSPSTLAWGNTAIACAAACNLLVIDEVGPLEIERGEGWQGAFSALEEGDFSLALVVVRPELVVQAQLRLPITATAVIAVTSDSRDNLPAMLLEMLEKEIHPTQPVAL